LHLPSKKELVKYEVCFLEVEDDVEFADVAIILVHLLDVPMDDLEGDQLVVLRGAASYEEERCISTIDNLAVW
jgi:hypothetical protein